MTRIFQWNCTQYRESSIGHCAMFDFRLLDQLANVASEDDGKGRIDPLPESSNALSFADTETGSCLTSSKWGKTLRRPISGIVFSDRSDIACVRGVSSASSIQRRSPRVSRPGRCGAQGVATTETRVWCSVKSTVVAAPTQITTYGSTSKTSAAEAGSHSWFTARIAKHAETIRGSLTRRKSSGHEPPVSSSVNAGRFPSPAVYHGGPALDVVLP